MPVASAIFEIFVDDNRYAVPTLHLVAAADDAAAREVADRLLAENSHHLGAEVCVDGKVLFRVGSFAARPRVRQSLRSGDQLNARTAD